MSARSLPELEPHCGSWIVVDRATGVPVFETWTREVAARVDQTRFEVLTAAQWLGGLMDRARKGGGA